MVQCIFSVCSKVELFPGGFYVGSMTFAPVGVFLGVCLWLCNGLGIGFVPMV